ncbi:hypothetical protein CspeluHIS016_0604240 [Cutaneotrichosporon spelunceum]|uniref:Bola-like protein n=1 Tax=Cutaneotrichosporon spelunceum TaxID=1672016 RepID=A0AAD3TY12_9TREE|nr:hypothetical protein CspeluHIS016_0604240 [Cutaneotrichosporon spelunceum]
MSLRLALRPLARPAFPTLARASLARAYASRAPRSDMGDGETAIYKMLDEAFPGTRLEVQDVSGGCGSFYAIMISSPAFKGLSMVKQHKLVNECLKETIKDIHGLQLKTIAEDSA